MAASHTEQKHKFLPSEYAGKHYMCARDFGTGAALPLHTPAFGLPRTFLFFLVIIGKGSFSYRGRLWEMKQGDCAFVDCDSLYSCQSDPSLFWEVKWVTFYGRDAEEFYNHYQELGFSNIFTPENPAVFNECISQIARLSQKNEVRQDIILHKQLTDLCTSCFLKHRSYHSGNASEQSKLLQIREYLMTHYHDKISLKQLCTIFFISKYYLIREYKKEFGITPINDLILCRLSHAKTLLRTGNASIESISEVCGFQSSSYFIRTFKRYETITPLEYRGKK